MKPTSCMVMVGFVCCIAACKGPVEDHTVTPIVSAAPPGTHAAAPQPGSVSPPASTPISAGAGPTPLSATNLTQGVPRTLTYDNSADAKPLIVVQDEMPTCHCAGKTWWVRYYSGSTEAGPLREVRLVIDLNGYVSEAEEINEKEKVEIVYTPPLALIPDKLPMHTQGNAGFEQMVKMVVHPLGDRSKVRTSGNAHNSIQYVADEKITTGAGDFIARKIEATVTADLAAAKTVDTTEQWLVDGVGIVCERDHEVTKVLGATVRENAATILLKSIEAAK